MSSKSLARRSPQPIARRNHRMLPADCRWDPVLNCVIRVRPISTELQKQISLPSMQRRAQFHNDLDIEPRMVVTPQASPDDGHILTVSELPIVTDMPLFQRGGR
jgi:hypothetical protein